MSNSMELTPARILDALGHITPFSYIDRELRRELAGVVTARLYRSSETIVEQGGDDRILFVLVDGEVGIFDVSVSPAKYNGFIGPMSYFGERAPLFHEERKRSIIAQSDTTCLLIDEATLLDIIARSKTFSHALARNLRERQGLFEKLEQFRTAVSEGAARGVLDFEELLELYRKLLPALHPKLGSTDLDINAWHYAIRRLPANVTQIHVALLSRSLPILFKNAAEIAPAIAAPGRRRATWALSPAKNLVLVRDVDSDVTDFITCLCLHAHESRKLRRRVRSPHVLAEIKRAIDSGAKACHDCIKALPLNEDEKEGLLRIWPEDLLPRLYDILLHHEDYAIFVDKALSDYNADASERWTEQIRRAATALVGDIDDPALEVDIISSNTHSVVNCLSPYLRKRAADILAWGEKHEGEIDAGLKDLNDRLYAHARRYLQAHPEEQAERERMDREHGIITLEETEFTGLQVDLIDLQRIDHNALDSRIRGHSKSLRRLIVNIDYAFGVQAEDIMGGLVLLFGQRIRSVSVLGKAGALQGRRGDILMPTTLIQQSFDAVYAIAQPGLDAEELRRIHGLPVHHGPVLTVPGTLLQNRELLIFYKQLWRCVGLEMEGSYYARRIARARILGLLRNDIEERFLYYVSDLPLNSEDNLATPLQAWEGIPPLYATTCAVLKPVLERSGS